MNAKETVRQFFESDFHKNGSTLDKFLHDDFELYWNSSTGYRHMNKVSFKQMLVEMSKSFESLRSEITHLLAEGNQVTIRFTYHVKPIENPEEEIPMGYFISIFEVVDGQLLKGFQISQPGDDTTENKKFIIPKK